MKRILIIGGTGYIGSRLFRYLFDANVPLNTGRTENKYIVHTIDLEWFGNYSSNQFNIKKDYATLTKEELSVYDVVILLAGYSSPTQCQNSPPTSVVLNNFENFKELILKLGSHQKFIYASSIAVYESGMGATLDEESKLISVPANLYETTKLLCDQFAWHFRGTPEFYGLRLATLSGVSNNFRSDLMVNAMTDSAVVTSKINVFNPEAHKPILYIHDLCRAIETIIDCKEDKRGFYNLASYNGITAEIAETVADVTNSELAILSRSEMKKNGLPNTSYDFIISTKKFEETFSFRFVGTTETITNEIVQHINTINHSKRIKGIVYK